MTTGGGGAAAGAGAGAGAAGGAAARAESAATGAARRAADSDATRWGGGGGTGTVRTWARGSAGRGDVPGLPASGGARLASGLAGAAASTPATRGESATDAGAGGVAGGGPGVPRGSRGTTARAARPVTTTAAPASSQPRRRGAGSSVAAVAVTPVFRTSGTGLRGVCTWETTLWVVPLRASVMSWVRVGSSCARVRAPIAAIASSTDGHRASGSFSSIRSTATRIASGQSGRKSSSGGTGSWKWPYSSAIMEGPANGGRPASISYATTPREYWSEAPVIVPPMHCSGLM